MINPSLGFVLLFVEAPLISAEFYSKILGLKPIEQYPTFALFALKNNVQLGLWAYKTAQPKITTPPGASEIAFSADNIDRLYEHLLKLGVPMIQTPTDMDFGRTFVAVDPDGHRIRFYRLREEQ